MVWEKGVARLQVREKRHEWVRSGVIANEDVVTLENAIGFGCGKEETV
jgi:hypothetical protein